MPVGRRNKTQYSVNLIIISSAKAYVLNMGENFKCFPNLLCAIGCDGESFQYRLRIQISRRFFYAMPRICKLGQEKHPASRGSENNQRENIDRFRHMKS